MELFIWANLGSRAQAGSIDDYSKILRLLAYLVCRVENLSQKGGMEDAKYSVINLKTKADAVVHKSQLFTLP